jgi:hypothetical protein
MLAKAPFLRGSKPGIADLAAYHSLWFIELNCRPETSPLLEFPRVVEWMARIKAIGHGTSEPMTAAEALEAAKAARPATAASADPLDPAGRKPGQRVRVTPDDFARVPVTGELVSSNADEIVIKRSDERAGDVLVHFPRAGFIVSPAKD